MNIGLISIYNFRKSRTFHKSQFLGPGSPYLFTPYKHRSNIGPKSSRGGPKGPKEGRRGAEGRQNQRKYKERTGRVNLDL